MELPAVPLPARLVCARLGGEPFGPPLRLVVALDVSLSSLRVLPAAAPGLDAFAVWLGGELRDDDELAVVDFAETARVRLEPAPVGEPFALPAPLGPELAHTASTLDALTGPVGALCAVDRDTVLVVLSTGELTGLPDHNSGGDADHLALIGLRAVRMPAFHRSGLGRVPGWDPPHGPAPRVYDGRDAEDVALALGVSLAALTGRPLVVR
ncbi:hypothetical protein JTP77_009565 [Streptomyces sp. S9]|nr:hypothetical protein [Streptomyces sp. S9]